MNDLIGGVIGEEHYTQWRDNFGMTGGGSGSAATASVPEPASALLLALATLGVFPAARRRRSVAGL